MTALFLITVECVETLTPSVAKLVKILIGSTYNYYLGHRPHVLFPRCSSEALILEQTTGLSCLLPAVS